MMDGTRMGRRAVLSLLAAGLSFSVVPTAHATSDREIVVAMVDAAAQAVAQHGFPRALSQTPPETWARPAAGLYVFVMDRRGTLLLHPDKRAEGRNVATTTDAQGKPFIRDIILACARHPEGAWTSYMWPSRDGALGVKHTYSRLAGGVVVSAGYVATDA